MSTDQLLTPNEAYQAIGSIEAHGRIQDKLMEAVKGTYACEELGLSNADVGRVADELFDYQLQSHFDAQNKKRYRKKAQERKIAATRNSLKGAAEHIGSVLEDPAVCGSVLDAVSRGFGWPDSEVNSYKILLESQQRLESLAATLDKLKAGDLPALDFGLRKGDVVRRIADVVPPHIGASKVLLADYIGDFLKLIGINIEHKTILNLLS